MRLRNKISVENANEVASRRLQPNLERTCFVADPVLSMDQLNVETALPSLRAQEAAIVRVSSVESSRT